MTKTKLLTLIFLVVVAQCLSFNSRSFASEPSWTSRVLETGEDRVQSNTTDILARPYRPLHFYGNTVRRRYYRGEIRPTAQDLRNTVTHIIVRQ